MPGLLSPRGHRAHVAPAERYLWPTGCPVLSRHFLFWSFQQSSAPSREMVATCLETYFWGVLQSVSTMQRPLGFTEGFATFQTLPPLGHS